MTNLDYTPSRHATLEELAKIDVPNEALVKINPYTDKSGLNFYDRLDVGRAVHDYAIGKKPFTPTGISIDRYFTDGLSDPFNSVGAYESRNISIEDDEGQKIFSMEAEIPVSWNENAGKVAASKYFFRPNDSDWKEKIQSVTGRTYEYSPRHLFGRVATFFGESGQKLGYFKEERDRRVFEDELKYLMINQKLAFNSPVNFNAGLHHVYGIKGSPGLNFVRDPNTGEVTKVEDGCYIHPQLHACFIKGPEDNLESILNHAVVEGGIFTNGSGVGQDLTILRAKGEPLSSGGKSSGPMSFFYIYDTVASAIKSGGKTRRAARMTTMRYWHPDIFEFMDSKVREDFKALTLMRAGFEPGFEGEAYGSVKLQNTNITIRLDKHFFDQVASNGDLELKYIKSGKVAKKVNAREMLKRLSFNTWRDGDPGVQYETPIQEYHTAKNSGLINSSNPCSEYMFLDDTSCNLASLNLLSFADDKGNFDIDGFKKAARLALIAQDIANDEGSYPDKKIAQISPEFRTVGLGYANLGALLMRKGLAYDSDEGRNFAAAITAILTGQAYKTSTEIAKSMGPFLHYEFNKSPMMDVMEKHRKSLDNVKWDSLESKLKEASYSIWDEAINDGKIYGFRNAQATVLAPTGTIGILMGCDTTGIEPVMGLKTKKNLAGGGSMWLPNEEIGNALHNLGIYSGEQINDILKYVSQQGVVEGSPHLNPDHYDIFDTAFTPRKNGRTISFQGHVKMLGSVQPFVSGAISKTNNLPVTATVKDIYDGFVLGHELGIKALSVFRYDSKPVSILSFGEKNPYKELKRGETRNTPLNTLGIEQTISIGEEGKAMKFHVRTGEFSDGTVARIFIDCAKSGSSMRGALADFAISISKGLSRGVSIDDLIETYVGEEYEPKGPVMIKDELTGKIKPHSYIKSAKSIADFMFRMIAVEYQGRLEYAQIGENFNTSKLRGVINGAIDVYRTQHIDAWDYNNVIMNPELGGFVPKQKEEVKIANDGNHKNEASTNMGIHCSKCGGFMDVTKAGCWECPNCFEKVGGCG